MASTSRPVLTQIQMEKLVSHLGEETPGRPWARIVKQFAGEEMEVIRGGWLHAVINIQDCVKVSWEKAVPEHFLDYAHVHREYIAPFYHNAVASDYVGYHRIAESVLTKGLTHSLFAELQPMGGWNALRNNT